jgi:hypothetical protein
MILRINSNYFLNSINQLSFAIGMCCVFFDVWTELDELRLQRVNLYSQTKNRVML